MTKQDFGYSNIESYGSFGYRPILPPVPINIHPALFDHMHQPHELPQFMRPRNKHSHCSFPYAHL